VLIAGVAAGEMPRFALTPRTFWALAYLTFFGSVLTYTAYVYALKSLRMTTPWSVSSRSRERSE